MLKITYWLSDIGQKASLSSGGDGKFEQELKVEKDDPSFADALALAAIDWEGNAKLRLTDYHMPRFDTPQTAAQLVEAYRAADRAKADKERRESDAKRDAAQAVLDGRVTEVSKNSVGSSKSWTPYETLRPAYSYGAPSVVVDSPASLAWKAELDLANANAKEAAEVEAARKRAEVEAAEEAAEARRQAWRDKVGLLDDEKAYLVTDGALARVPAWNSHARGKNWMAVISLDPRSPGGLARDFAAKARGDLYYILPDLQAGDPVEFGADYYTGGGKPSRDRWYGVYLRTIQDGENTYAVFVQHDTAREAVTAGKHAATSK